MASRRRVEYPRVIYGPHGASLTINGPAEWIPGWSSTPERADALAPAHAATVVPVDRRTLKRRLRAAKVPFTESAADSELWRLLQAHGTGPDQL